LLSTEFAEPVEQIQEKLLSEGRWSGELIHKRKDGAKLVVLSRWVLDRDEQGNRQGTLETNNDITQLRRTAEALREREEQLQALTQELEGKVRTRTEELRELWNRLVLAQDTERRTIARELHDNIGQYLVALTMVLEDAKSETGKSERLSEAVDIAKTCIKEVRTVSHLLHPPLLEEARLASAASWYIEGFAARSGIEVDVDIDPAVGHLPKNIELALFRVLQESLTNVHRHSGSTTVAIRIGADTERVWLEIRDQGKGMPVGMRAGIGIKGMRERIENLAGKLQIDSNDGGTQVRVVLPLAPQESATSTVS
jgi:signal transduction histidine kinase